MTVWQAAVVLFGATTLLFAATWAHLRFWVRRLTLPMSYALELRLPTPDGSAFELRRISTPADAARGLPPVLLVHGLAINHRNLDVHPDRSLARELDAAGRDVWLLTLRSGRTDLGRREGLRARFAAMAHYDVPLAVAEVLRRTGAPQVDYVGFSMGGMLLYASLGRALLERLVRRAVIIGSPGRVLPLARWLGHLPAWATPGVPLRLLSRLLAFAVEWFTTPIHGIVVNPRNAEPGLSRLALVDAVQDIPAGLLHDFVTWGAGGGSVHVDREPALDGLRRVTVPVHFFAGAADRLGGPAAVRLAHDAWGREAVVEKHFTVLGRQQGHCADYGHGDLAMGRRVRDEVFAPAAAFLAAGAVVRLSDTATDAASSGVAQGVAA